MGMTRKALSGVTLGLVDFRSDKERTAAYAKGTRRQARKQTKILRSMADEQRSERTAENIEAVGQRVDKVAAGLSGFGARMQARADAINARTEARKAK